jgi:CheY-like chemotaxis protein
MLARIQREDCTMSTMMYCSPFAPELNDEITAHGAPLTRKCIKRSGMVKSLRKPFEQQELLAAIHRVA